MDDMSIECAVYGRERIELKFNPVESELRQHALEAEQIRNPKIRGIIRQLAAAQVAHDRLCEIVQTGNGFDDEPVAGETRCDLQSGQGGLQVIENPEKQ